MSARKLTQEDLVRVQGMSLRTAAEELGVGKSTIHDARQAAAANGGYLPAASATVEGRRTSVPKTEEEIKSELQARGISDETHRISVSHSIWDGGVDGPKYSFKATATPLPAKETDEADADLTVSDLPLLYSEVNARSVQAPERAKVPEKSLVVVWADIQVGKTGSRGGTPELIERIAQKKEALREYMYWHPAKEAFFLSVGDEVESFENVAQQAFTNDLSFPDQLDLELTFELDMITTLARGVDKVTVAGCSSNHCRWRAGKGVLGKPKDDYGLYIKRQLEKALRLNSDYDRVTFEYPEPWDETMAVEVQGTRVGIAHGHQVNNPNNIEDWWRKQVFGRGATADADILVTGHFHTFRAQPVGRSQRTGKNRWWLQAPTLDNGSDWYRDIQGSDSDEGLLVFLVDENGLDLQSLTIL